MTEPKVHEVQFSFVMNQETTDINFTVHFLAYRLIQFKVI